jgi:pimeloyl-ACP methyl ester carboxylesterase
VADRTRSSATTSVRALVERFDHEAFDLTGQRAVIRLTVSEDESWDAVVDPQEVILGAGGSARADAILSANAETWNAIAADVSTGLHAFRTGHLRVRRNLHLGIGFLAATSQLNGPGRLRFRRVASSMGDFSVLDAGIGDPVLMLHGLGGTKASFMPTVGALAPHFRTIAVDLLGFGDSDKPLGAAYDAAFQARGVASLLDALEIDRAHLIGHSMGGRVALELGFTQPDRVRGLVLMTPAMAWLRNRPWAPYLRWVRPELGFLQLTPRGLVEAMTRRLIPGADTPWGSSGIDEFVRTYTNPRGRVAFYAAARHIYLDEPHGERGFWTRLRRLSPEALFVWGRKDPLVPLSFARHVEDALPAARHVEIDCGHLPQIERPRETHSAIAAFLREVGRA